MGKLAVIYWSQTGNTAAMANAILQGAKEGGADASLYQVSEISAEKAAGFDLLALGCPAMGAEVLEEGEFEPFFTDLEAKLSGKKVALFGSYGWGDGEWMRDWQDRTTKTGAILFKGVGLILNETPDEGGLATCRAFGKDLASF